MHKKLIRTIAAALACCALLSGAASASSIGGATVNTALRLRSGAGTAYDIIATLPAGTAVVVEQDAGGGWYRVNANGTRGYMSAQYLSYSQNLALTATGWVNGSNVRVRAGAGTDTAILGALSTGAEVSISGVFGGWYRISSGSLSGYMYSDYIVLSKDEITAALPIGQQIVDFGKQYMGYSYVWAGASPSTGFDCSGFVSYCFKSFGYDTMRTAADIYWTNGYSVDKDSLQIGDALFFSSSSSYVGHTGIYIGDGQFIHASSGAGCVTISGLDESYYSRMYVGAKRIAE